MRHAPEAWPAMFLDDPRKRGLRHNPFKALAAPRPIARVIIACGSSVDVDGVANLAPFGDDTSVETVFEMLRPD